MTTQKNAAVGDRSTNEELVQRLQEGDASAAEELLRQNSGYLTVLAKQYDKTVRGPSLEEDLKQEGAMAILKAAEQFDPSMGNRFLTYATPAIQAALRRWKRPAADDPVRTVSPAAAGPTVHGRG